MPSVDPTLFDLHRTRVQALCDRVQAEISVRHDTDHLPVFFGFNHGHDAYIPVLHDTGRPRGCIKGQATGRTRRHHVFDFHGRLHGRLYGGISPMPL
jgi:hypothetical protein